MLELTLADFHAIGYEIDIVEGGVVFISNSKSLSMENAENSSLMAIEEIHDGTVKITQLL
jgi:hypothetical protein